VAMEDVMVDGNSSLNDEQDDDNNAAANIGAQQKWGPSHSFASDELSSEKETKAKNGGGVAGGFNNLFKPVSSQKSPPTSPSSPSKSKGSHANNSNETDPTAPVTTSTTTGEQHPISQNLSLKTGISYMNTAPATPGSNIQASAATTTANTGTTAAIGGGGSGASSAVITNFWNNHAQPATSDEAAASSSVHSTSPIMSPLSTSAKAAADAVMGMFSKAENFIVSSTGGAVGSPAAGGGLCSPRSSPKSSNLSLEGILEETEEDCADTTNICGGNGVNHCFEFEDFGFNAFQEEDQQQQPKQYEKNEVVASSPVRDKEPPTLAPEQQSPQPKGYEIRLKSSFSQAKAQKQLQKEKKNQQQLRTSPTNLLGATFGRTHPNNKKKSLPNQTDQQQQQSQRQEDMNEFPQSSRALPDGLPFREVSVPTEIERSVSELTMRSHGAFERQRYTSDSRRMAYYAVGRTMDDHGKNKSSGGGNRRCYFSGMEIPYGMPFYAGSVQQGPRTLVVFCLPSALGLPRNGNGAVPQDNLLHRFSTKADREKYLETLPEPNTKLLQEMSKRYPEPFDTLPVQVRSPHCWRLFVKFCFFSGLPIAEGEMHYRVKSLVTVFPPSSSAHPQHQEGEEIALSHEVMEAVNGEVSAEILRLPNQNLFDYLKRQYSQQSSKLSDEVFVRSSWEMVRPEV
ncbi:hypothetical protein ACHAXR_005929, partial [Thalassiosira sp. AJA248-18]